MARYLPLLVVVIWILAYWPTFSLLWQRWVKWDEAVAHGLPVLAIFLFFIYRRLPEFSDMQSGKLERVAAFALLLIGSVFWAIFYLISIDILAQLILLPLLVLSLCALYGFRVLTRFALIWPFFLFAIPVWDYLNEPLLFLSSEFVGAMVRMAGMPAVIQGNSIFIPNGHILIADGCSGLRYLVIALALGYLVALLNQYKLGKLSVTLVVAGLLGLVTNWIRIFILIVVGYKTEMQSSLMADHEYFGWALFALICLPALFMAPVVKPTLETPRKGVARTPPLSGLMAVAIALASAPLMSTTLLAGGPLPEVAPMLGGVGEPVSDTFMPVSAPEAALVEIVYLPNRNVYVRMDHYRQVHQGEKLVPYIKRLYDSSYWLPVTNTTQAIEQIPVKTAVFQQKGGRRQVAQIQWLTTGPYHSASVVGAKLWQIPARLSGHRQFRITTLQASCVEGDCGSALSRLQTAASELLNEEATQL